MPDHQKNNKCGGKHVRHHIILEFSSFLNIKQRYAWFKEVPTERTLALLRMIQPTLFGMNICDFSPTRDTLPLQKNKKKVSGMDFPQSPHKRYGLNRLGYLKGQVGSGLGLT